MASSAIAQAVAASQEAAKSLSEVTTAAQTADIVPIGTNLPVAGPKVTMKDMQGGMDVDVWIKVSEDGLKLGTGALAADAVKVSIDMRDGIGFTCKYAIKAGNPASHCSW